MTNYNDGKWHIWNGGECPVHPKTLVAAIWSGIGGMHENDEVRGVVRKAEDFQEECWKHLTEYGHADIIAFRVIKEHKEPREFWMWNASIYDSKQSAYKAYRSQSQSIYTILSEPLLVREVLE